MILEDLETDRLIFKSLTIQDVGSLLPFFQDEKAMEFLTTPTLPLAQHVNKWVTRQLERYDQDGYGLSKLILKETGEMVGLCGLLYQIVDEQEEMEIGYRLMPGHWGKGYATEAAVACRDYALSLQAAPSIISIIHVKNVNSQRVAARNGMVPTKETQFHDKPVVIYRITRSEWLDMMNMKHDPSEQESVTRVFDQFDQIKSSEIPKSWNPQKVFLFSGHMIDQPDRAEPRFPASKEAAASAAIKAQLKALDADSSCLAICGGASGGDLIFAEACREAGARVELRIPFSRGKYLEGSVKSADFGEATPTWESRFMNIWNDPSTRNFVLSALSANLSDELNPYALNNLWMLHEALSYGAENVYFICLWNGKAGDGPGGTDHMYELVKERNGQVFWIDTRKL